MKIEKIEFVGQPADDLLDGQTTGIPDRVGAPKHPYGAECIVAQIEMVVFDTENQALPEGIVETDAQRPAIVGLSLGGERTYCRFAKILERSVLRGLSAGQLD